MIYENERVLTEYLLLHYGTSEDLFNGLPGPLEAMAFPLRVVRELLDPSRLLPTAKALDIGCAVGGSSFELARHCVEVLGIDQSEKFISAASILLNQGVLSTQKIVEGELTAPFVAQVPADIPKHGIRFQIGNAMEVRGEFDVVLAANLLCRLPFPLQFLELLPALVRPGGQLLLATPFSWLEDFTPRTNWLGGKEDQTGWEMLTQVLTSSFEFEEKRNLPFLIREHARKFQYGISLGSRWIRRH